MPKTDPLSFSFLITRVGYLHDNGIMWDYIMNSKVARMISSTVINIYEFAVILGQDKKPEQVAEVLIYN